MVDEEPALKSDKQVTVCSKILRRSVTVLAKNVVNVMGIPTVVACIGEISNSDACGILIPGNPGIIEFYDVFLTKLYEDFGPKLPIIGLAQAGNSR